VLYVKKKQEIKLIKVSKVPNERGYQATIAPLDVAGAWRIGVEATLDGLAAAARALFLPRSC